MLNEERVIMMTHMASYENGEGKKNVKIGSYFRSDYIAVQILKSLICGTIAFAVVFALYVFYDFEVFMQNLYKADLIELAKKILMYYAVTVAGYGIVTYIVCTYRYAEAKHSLKRYYHSLKKLNSLYGGESAPKKTAGGRR
ncbi:MAG: hypothetical protein NC541_09255 [bacterium]|nr:hypothetical protein [bacterium]